MRSFCSGKVEINIVDFAISHVFLNKQQAVHRHFDFVCLQGIVSMIVCCVKVDAEKNSHFRIKSVVEFMF